MYVLHNFEMVFVILLLQINFLKQIEAMVGEGVLT